MDLPSLARKAKCWRQPAPQESHARSTMSKSSPCGMPPKGGSFGNLVRLLLLTGARRGEIAKLTHDSILKDRIVLPPFSNQTGVPSVTCARVSTGSTTSTKPWKLGCNAFAKVPKHIAKLLAAPAARFSSV
jgi:hypothetical protein